MSRPRRPRLLLALLLLASATLMAWHGSADPHGGRFWDERYGFANVASLLSAEGGPANAFYPSLSYLPQTAVLWLSERISELTGVPALSIYDPAKGDGWSETAYLLVRWVSALFGVLAVWTAYRVGSRLFEPRVGLLGAALFAVQPALVQSAAIFKPDVLVAWLVLVVFLWSLDAALHPSGGRYAKVGVGVGLAVAAKYTGVGAALPVVVGSLGAGPGAWRDRRRWLWLVAAGAVSVATFLVLNPHVATILAYIPRLFEIAEGKSEAEGGSHLLVLVHQGRFLVRHHGWVVLAFAAAGRAGRARRAVGRETGFEARLEARMVSGFVVGYSLLYAAVIEAFRGQNYIPVSAFTALAAAWAMIGLWDRLAARLPALRSAAVAAPVWGLVLVALFARPALWIYDQVVPTTWSLAGGTISTRLAPLEERQVIFEKERRGQRLDTFHQGHHAARLPVERLTDLAAEELRRSDVLVFPAERLEGRQSGSYLSLVAEAGGRVTRLDPRFLGARGPALVLLFQGWQEVGEPLPLPLEELSPHRYRTELPEPRAGELWSLGLWLPLERGVPRPRWVKAGGRELPLFSTRVSGRRAHYLTPRFEPPPGGAAELALEDRLAMPFAPQAALYRWRRGEGR